jgi:hypothetical protein
MANKGGIVTRRDMFSDDAMAFGEVYAKQLNVAIDANKVLVDSVKELNKQVQNFKVANNQKDYIAAKQAEALATQQAIDAIKRQEAAEISANRIRISSLATIDAERKAKQAATDAENKLQKAKASGVKPTAEEIINQRILAKNADNHAIANSKLASEYDKLTAKARIAATALQNILIAGQRGDETLDQYNLRLQQAQLEFDELQRRVIAANRAIGRFNDNVGNYPEQAASAIRDLMEAFGLVVGLETFVDITKQAFDIVRNFEAEIVNLAAIAQKSRVDIQPLEADIRAVAKESINSATEVAQLATELIKLGSTPEEVSKLLKPVNNLSIALQTTAEDSATLVKSLLNAYQEGADQATHYTDVLAESANRSALDFDGLRDSFSYLAPVAKTLNIPIERTAAIIGTLTDNGIKAESAGRLMATGLGRLSTQGLTLEDALKKINKAQKDNKSSMDVLNIANKLFGGEAGKLGLILANNVEKINESTLAYQNSGGALEELTNKQLKSINSELEILSSGWEEYILDTNEAAGGTKAMTTVLRLLSNNLKLIIDSAILAGSIWLAYRASLLLAVLQSKLMALALGQQTVAQAQNVTVVGFGTAAQTANTAATTLATTAWQRFNAALKANMLGLIVAGLIAVLYYYNKFTKSLEETTAETKNNTDVFLKNREVASKNAISINTLSNRYDVLKAKAKLTVEEQKELNKIIETLSKTVPGATSEMDKYGNAIAINTAKTREYVKAKNEMVKAENKVKLKENIELLKDLKTEQNQLNVSTDKAKGSLIEGIGYVVKINGVLQRRSNIFKGYVDLTEEELAIYAKKRFQNEEALANTIAQIRQLKGLTDAQKSVLIEKEKADKQQQENAPRTIAIIDEEIKAQEDLITALSDKTGKEGRIIKAKIKALNAERDLIYNNNKSQEKDEEKLIKKQLDNQKKIREAIYNLNQFRLANAIEVNQLIIENDKSSTEKKLDAYLENEQLRSAKNNETLEHELVNNALEGKELEKLTATKRKLYIQSANDRVQSIISGAMATEKMTNEEKLILEKYLAEKKKLELQGVKDKQIIIDSEVAIIQKQIDDELQEKNRKLNRVIQAENEMFLALNNVEKQSRRERELAIIEHERKIFEIKKQFAIDALRVQIDGVQKELDANAKKPIAEQISTDKRKKIEADLQAYLAELSDIELQNYVQRSDQKVEYEKFTAEKIIEISQNLADSINNLANAIFDTKIQNIDAEISANNDKYAKEIEAAGKDERQKELLQKERDKKNEELEKKKRKEQTKQAAFNKAVTIAQIGLQTALAIITAAAATAPTFWGVAIAATIGAIELGAAIATPIPKYKMGRKDGPEEWAYVGDGGVQEVIERKSGAIEITPATDTLVKLKAGDKVHSSVDEYYRLQRASMMASINMEGRKMNDYQASQSFEKAYGKEIVEELRETRKTIQKQKNNIIINNKIDIPHAIWKDKNINWN